MGHGGKRLIHASKSGEPSKAHSPLPGVICEEFKVDEARTVWLEERREERHVVQLAFGGVREREMCSWDTVDGGQLTLKLRERRLLDSEYYVRLAEVAYDSRACLRNVGLGVWSVQMRRTSAYSLSLYTLLLHPSTWT